MDAAIAAGDRRQAERLAAEGRAMAPTDSRATLLSARVARAFGSNAQAQTLLELAAVQRREELGDAAPAAASYARGLANPFQPVSAAALAGLARPARAMPAAEWEAFKARFLHPDSRVVDTGNGGVSHTEGQGWGLLFAVAFDDPAAFGAVLDWTTGTLRRGRDALHAWRYVPGGANPVPGANNATDGDLFIAMALFRAARRWSPPAYAARATVIARDVLRLLVRRAGPRTLLLPGGQGFETPDAFVVNPSCYVFPALQELAAHTRDPLWAAVQSDGLALMRDGRFGRWMLPPDWLQVSRASGALEPANGWAPRFSYDAIRVPLYLSWAGRTATGADEAFRAYWAQQLPDPPAWVDLATGGLRPTPRRRGCGRSASFRLRRPPPTCRQASRPRRRRRTTRRP